MPMAGGLKGAVRGLGGWRAAAGRLEGRGQGRSEWAEAELEAVAVRRGQLVIGNEVYI